MFVDLPEIPPLDRFTTYASHGLVQLMEPITESLMVEREARRLVDDEFDSPHAQAWHLSFHASESPSDDADACKRYLLYRMMNIPATKSMAPYVTSTGAVGKAGEIYIADAWYKGGRMLGFPEGAEASIDWKRLPPRKVYPDGHPDAGEPLPIRQLGFKVPSIWMTASTDLPVLMPSWRKPYIVEVKCKADEVLDEMISGVTKNGTKLAKLRGPDTSHVRQLKATIAASREFDWGVVALCEHCWRIAGWTHVPMLLNLDYEVQDREPFPMPWSDSFYYCRWCRAYDPVFVDLDQPDCGEIYYWSRSWPRAKTKSFFYEHDIAADERMRRTLAEARQDFIDGALPPRPEHFQWSLGPCQFCTHKPNCRLDAGLQPRKRKPDEDAVVDRLQDSNAITFARMIRPRYDYQVTRERVLNFWSEQS